MEINDITGTIIEEAIKIPTDSGPGLLESVHEEILFYRLNKRGVTVKRQTPIPLYYEDIKMDIGFRSDLIVEDRVIVEIKSVESIAPVHPKNTIDLFKINWHNSWIINKLQ